MNVVRCDYDGCDDSRPADGVTSHSWLHVEQPQGWGGDSYTWDFCCSIHLASWAKARHDLQVRR